MKILDKSIFNASHNKDHRAVEASVYKRARDILTVRWSPMKLYFFIYGKLTCARKKALYRFVGVNLKIIIFVYNIFWEERIFLHSIIEREREREIFDIK